MNSDANADKMLGLIARDTWLAPYEHALRRREAHYARVRASLDEQGGLLGTVSQGHHYFGFNRGERDGIPGVWYREWAPAAQALFLTGDFNQWDRFANPLTRDEWGVWSLFLPDVEYANRLTHGSMLKVHVRESEGRERDRIPAYARRVLQEPGGGAFTAQFWMPEAPYVFAHPSPPLPGPEGLRVYEAHVGMAQEEGKVGSFDEFTERVLPRIVALGYNTLQLMAIMEHPYYGSFGYHVSSFFAVSSRFGTPEELKRLIDTAHGYGLRVLLDLVHSHAVKNTLEGLNHFDGTEWQYFHAGERGYHTAWDSLVFDYSKFEVQRFLLSNVRFWLEEFRFDGFRFDGVTSMLYTGHGLNRVFTTYADYFGDDVDEDALVYLQLANDLTRAVDASSTTVAEDVSGMPGLAVPVTEGGAGFDYRLAMGIPDYWIRVVKSADEEWQLEDIWRTLLNRRWGEKHIGYAESHDQSIVGDQTLAFRLMDKEMYWGMNVHTPNIVVERGIALHKMIRLITFSLAGEGYLNFIGNEFGHPEWVDFPREGNGFSFQHARRQWSLVDNPDLRFRGLNQFDAAMQCLDKDHHLLTNPLIEQLSVHEQDKLLVYRHGALVFVFNFHSTASYTDLRIPVPDATDYRLLLNTDDTAFAGRGHVDTGTTYPLQTVPYHGREQSIQLYLPSRSAQVLIPAP
jgi:1,4-alpha-glucan branching enzyme